MAELKPAYLIHGDDHGAIAERRAGLRALAEGKQDAGWSLELFEGERGTPEAVALALTAMTLGMGRRVMLVEGVERWRQADVEKQLAPAMSEMPPDTTVALFAREEARAKAPAALHEAVRKAGGQVVARATVKPWELPGWVREQAARMGVSLDGPAAKALVGHVGQRQQRLLRELEKLALEADEPSAGAAIREITVEDVERLAARSSEQRAFSLADALVGGNAREATTSYLRLREQGERLAGLTYMMAQRLREAVAIAEGLRAGESVAEVRRGLRMPARAAERLVSDVARTDPERLRGALGVLAELELDSRGGPLLCGSRSPLAGLSEETQALRAIEAITIAPWLGSPA